MARRAVSETFVFPTPVVLLTCRSSEGRENILTLAWVGVACSDPPMVTVAIRPQRFSHSLVVETGEFVLNVPRAEMLETVDFCGMHSGREMDKFEATGLTPTAAEVVSASVIEECPYAVECKVEHMLRLGTHDLFVARVVAAHADESVLTDKGKMDHALLAPIAYCPHRYFSLGEYIGRYGMSKKEG